MVGTVGIQIPRPPVYETGNCPAEVRALELSLCVVTSGAQVAVPQGVRQVISTPDISWRVRPSKELWALFPLFTVLLGLSVADAFSVGARSA